MKPEKEFWDRVNSLIKKKGFTQASLSEKLNFSARRIQNLSGANRLPDLEEGVLIAKELGTTAEYLVSGTNTAKSMGIPRDLQDIINKYAEKDDKKQKKDLTNGVSDNYNLSELPPL